MPDNYNSNSDLYDDEVIIITPPPDPVDDEIIGDEVLDIDKTDTTFTDVTVINDQLDTLDSVINTDTDTTISEAKPVKELKKEITPKKVVHFISSVLLYSILTILAIIFIMFVAYVVDQKIGDSKGEKRSPLFGAYVIISESMVPKIKVNDAVVTMRVSEKNIHVNDIITFLSKDIETKGTPITHRVVGIVYEDKENKKVLGYRTKGDNNNTQDFALIKPNEVLGKVYIRIPKVGYLQSFISKPIGWIICIVIPCMILVFSDTIKIIDLKKKEE